MTKSFLDFCIAALSFWAFGFALMFGDSAAEIQPAPEPLGADD